MLGNAGSQLRVPWKAKKAAHPRDAAAFAGGAPSAGAVGGPLGLGGVTTPMVSDVPTPVAAARRGRLAKPPIAPVRLLLATETEVTATDFTSHTELETEAEGGGGGGGGGGNDTKGLMTHPEMITSLAYRKDAMRRRKLRRRTDGSLGPVKEGEEPGLVAEHDSDRDVKKVVKKAEKAAQKITSSLRSLQQSKTSNAGGGGGDGPGSKTQAVDLGKRGRRSDVATAAAADVAPPAPPAAADRRPASTISQLQERIIALQGTLRGAQMQRRYNTMQSRANASRRRHPAGDIMQLVSSSHLAQQWGLARLSSGDLTRHVRGGGGGGGSNPTTPRDGSPAKSPMKKSPIRAPDADAGAFDVNGDVNGDVDDTIDDDMEDDDEEEEEDVDVVAGAYNPRAIGARGKYATKAKSDDDDDDDDDEEEEEEEEGVNHQDVKQAVSRIQAIVKSQEAREQYLRLRQTTVSMQERLAARGRDAEEENLEVEDDDDE